MRYRVKQVAMQDVVDVHLSDGEDGIDINVGDWIIGTICHDGTFKFVGCIAENNDAGIQVDDEGEIMLK